VVDISNINAPRETTIYNKGFTSSIALHPNGRILYAVIADTTIRILRVDDPYKVKSLGQVGHPNAVFKDLVCTGPILLAAGGPRGVYAFSVEHPRVITRISRFKEIESADDLALDGRLLAVGGSDPDGVYGVTVVNYPTWDAPAKKGFLAFDTQILDLTRVPSLPSVAVVALGDAGYAVTDLSDPTNPQLLLRSPAPVPVTAAEPALSGPTVFLSCAYDGLWRADFAAGTPDPTLTKMMEANVVARTLASKGDVVYISTADKKLEVWDFSDPLQPGMAAALETPRTAQHLLVRGDLLVASCETEGFLIYDISQPLNPLLLSTTNPVLDGGGAAVGTDIRGHLLALANADAGMKLYDVTDPSSPIPILAGTWNAKLGYVRGVLFGDDTTLWCTQSTRGLQSLRINAPGTAPTELGSAHLTDTITGQFCIAGDYAFSSGLPGVEVIHIADPAKPDNTRTLGYQQAYFAGCWDGALYVARGPAGLEEWSLDDPDRPHQTRIFNTPGLASSLTRTDSGTFVLVDGEGGIWSLVLSDCPGPILRFPCDGQVVPYQNTVLFAWEPGDATAFRVEVSKEPGFPKGDQKTLASGKDDSDLLKSASWIPNDSKWKKIVSWGRNATLYWRVHLFDSKGNKLAISEIRTFGL
jgi:hypothetical protein